MSFWCSLLFRRWRNPRMMRPTTCRAQVLRGAFLFGSTIFNFLALETLQLAETTSISFFAPMVITALAGPLLGEWAGWRRWLAILVGFCRRPDHHPAGRRRVRPRPCLCARLDAVHCFYVIMTRRMAASETLGEPDLLFGAGAGGADAAVCAVHGLAAAGWLALVDPDYRWASIGGVRPLAADPGLPAWQPPRRWRPIPICRWSG